MSHKQSSSGLQRNLKGFNTEALPYRLNWQCEILLTRNQEAIKGKIILRGLI
jgi:hypothetical protein